LPLALQPAKRSSALVQKYTEGLFFVHTVKIDPFHFRCIKQEMEQTVVFEQKVYLTPKDMNRMAQESVDDIILGHLQDSLENKCSQHGFVLPGKLEILSRDMGLLENGRYTGNILYHVHAQGVVYNPVNGTKITGRIIKKNKMGLYVVYENAIRILIARDLHYNNEKFEALQIDDIIQVEIRKSRFQINDPFILSIGVFLGSADEEGIVEVPAVPLVDADAPSDTTDTTEDALDALDAPLLPPVPVNAEGEIHA
jgi:DNA-directed RNA polymerase subunit E'/Rpb7